MTTLHIPTGIDFLDRQLGGGQLPQGLHGLLGPISGGKTTLGTMIAVEGARIQWGRALRGQPAGRWVFIIDTQPGSQIEKLAEWHAARKRFDSSNEILDNHFHLIDWASLMAFGESPTPVHFISCYLDGVREVAPISGVVIDFVGALTDRFMDARSIPPEKSSSQIRKFVSQSRGLIANRFGCPVWLIHQLTGVANGRSPLIRPTHGDAKACRHFGDDLDVCFSLGTEDRRSNSRILNCSKLPDADPPAPLLLAFERNKPYASLVEASDFRISSTLARIVPTNSAQIACDDRTRELLRQMAERDRNRS